MSVISYVTPPHQKWTRAKQYEYFITVCADMMLEDACQLLIGNFKQ